MKRKTTEVDTWLDAYVNPMKLVVERIRAIVLGADPRIDECIKWQAPTFIYRGNLASFFPKSKQHASLMFHTGALIPGRHPLLVGDGDTGRVLKIGTVAEANAAKPAIERIVKAWCDARDAESPEPEAKPVRAASSVEPRRMKPARTSSRGGVKPVATKPGYDEQPADRIRRVLRGREDVVEKRMFGGLCFMVSGKMCCGLTKTDLVVRVGKDGYAAAVALPHARPMDFTGRPLAGMVYVDPAGYATPGALAKWVGRGIAFVTAAAPETRRAVAKKTRA